MNHVDRYHLYSYEMKKKEGGEHNTRNNCMDAINMELEIATGNEHRRGNMNRL